MPKYRVTAPDGRAFEVTAPDGATQEQVLAYAKQQFEGMSKRREASDADKKAADPTRGGLDNTLAGIGKAFADTGRGVGQLIRKNIETIAPPQKSLGDLVTGGRGKSFADTLGLPTDEDVAEARRLDAPLMATTGGKVGNFTGNVAVAVPSMLAGPGLVPAVATGAAMGFAQPTVGDESNLKNAALGGAAGAAGVALGKIATAGYQGAKALIEPFTQRGREQIAGRMINRFAENPGRISSATSAPTITGARPTLAEQTGDRGLAQLQDSLRAADPQFANQITARLTENNAARVNALEGLTGRDGAKAFAEANRNATAQQLYGDAFSATNAVTPSQLKAQVRLLKGKEIEKLLQAPAVQDAVKQAQTNALNAGRKMTADGSIEGLHNVKLAIDDMIKDPATAAQANKMAALRMARDRVVKVIETLSPDYKAARVTYRDMSKPVNAFDIGEEVFKRATSNTSDLAGNPRMQANALMGLLKDEPALIKRATGRTNAGNSLADVLDPQQLATLRGVASEADRAAAVASAGNGPGSATAQRMAAQNVLRQIIGPTGLPQSWAENALANTIVGKPLNLIYGGIAEPKIQQELARAILDPDQARAVLQAARAQGVKLPPGLMFRLTSAVGRSVAPAVAVSGER